jgi:hypothetical protein
MPAVLVAIVLAAALTAASAWAGSAGIYAGGQRLELTCSQLDHAADVLLSTIVAVPARCKGSLDCIAENEMAAHAEKLLDVVLAIRRQECSKA